MYKLKTPYFIFLIILSSVTITTVLADTVNITTYPYVIQDGSNIQRLVVTSSGNVGIGIPNPWGNLQVNGSPGSNPTIVASSAGHYFYFNPNECQGCINGMVQAGDQALIYSNGPLNTGNFVLGNWNSGTAGIRITSSGNVGIGVAFPVQKLDVNGGIHLTGNVTSPNSICIGSC